MEEPDVGFGSPTVPRNTVDLKELKTCLSNGARVAFKNDKHAVLARLGPSAHQIANPHVSVLSVVSVDVDLSSAAKQIDRDKSIYLTKTGDAHHS